MCDDEPLIDQLIQLVGEDLTIRLLRAYGGQQKNIPRQPLPEHWLTTLLGLEAASLLCFRFGGDRLQLPRGLRLLNKIRDQRICDRRAEGRTIAELVAEFDLTKRRIYQVLSANRQDCTLTSADPQR